MARFSGRFLVPAACVTGLLAAAAPASACGYRRHAAPRHQVRDERAPLIVGDSTMIFAAPVLGRLGIEADAKECRQFTEGIDMLGARRRAGRLPRVAILALGANGPISRGDVERALSAIGPGHVLGLVTPRNLSSVASVMRRSARERPARVRLIDWVARSAGHGGWFAGDGLHVNFTGARAFADYVRRAIAAAIDVPPQSLDVPRDVDGAKHCGTLHRFGKLLAVHVLRGARKMTCRRARALARRPPLQTIANWSVYDRPGTGRPPWVDVYARADGEVLVGLVPARE